MPQATDELRKEWGIAPDKAIEFLEKAGFQLTRYSSWILKNREPTSKENRAIDFLFQEWDFGDLQIVRD